MSGTAVPEAVEVMAGLRAAVDRFAAVELSSLSAREVLALMAEYEEVGCQLPVGWHRMLTQLQGIAGPRELGAKNWKDVLALYLRISTASAHRLLAAAKVLGPRTSLLGEPLAPDLPALAAAQAAGRVNAEHVAIIRDVVTRIRHRVDAVTAAQAEVDLVKTALEVGPKDLEALAAMRLFQLDQDGPEPDDRERDKQRGLIKRRQRRNGLTRIEVEASPELTGYLEAFCAKFAAPGMCNPDDPEPCVTGTPSRAQIDDDHRSVAQRQHDALTLMARIAMMTDLGTVNGLPVQVIITTTLQELESAGGVAITGGGTRMSTRDVIRVGAHAHWSLAMFDKATGAAMNLFRAKRIASPAQRLMLIARDKGCTKPGCTVGPYGCEVHHAQQDWIEGGNTNVDDNGLACGGDHALAGAGPHRWVTTVIRGVVHWFAPDGIDTGQATVNYRNRPDLIPVPDPDTPWPWEKAPATTQRSPIPTDASEASEVVAEAGSGSTSEGGWDPDTPPFPPDLVDENLPPQPARWHGPDDDDDDEPPFPPDLVDENLPPQPARWHGPDDDDDELPFPPLESDTAPESPESSAEGTTAPHPTPECRPSTTEPESSLPRGDDVDTDGDTDDSGADENGADTESTRDDDRLDARDEAEDDEDSGYVRIHITPSGFTIPRIYHPGGPAPPPDATAAWRPRTRLPSHTGGGSPLRGTHLSRNRPPGCYPQQPSPSTAATSNRHAHDAVIGTSARASARVNCWPTITASSLRRNRFKHSW